MLRKKGDPTDITLLLIILFFLAVSFIVAMFTNDILQGVIDDTVLNESAAYNSITSAFTTINTVTTQRGFVLFFALLIIGILGSSFLIKVHPFFIFIYIITLSMAIFVAVPLANTYESLITNPSFAVVATNSIMITFVMENVVKILVATWVLSVIIIFGKIVGGSGGIGSSGADI